MKILEVNKFYYRRGGAESYVLELEEKLTAEGHEVAVFAMHHPKNLASPWSRYFVSRISFNEGGLLARCRGALRSLYSFEARRKFKALLEDFKPDVIHIHNIYHQLSPSILSAAKKRGIPVIMHLHDYKLISPNYQLFCRGRICYDGAAPRYWQCFFRKCFRDSYAASFLVALEMWLHHRVLRIYEKNISRYIAPSRFMKDICVRFGVPADAITVLYNFVQPVEALRAAGDKIVYFGRLSEEKGVAILIRAMAQVPERQLTIAGEGPERSALEGLVAELKLEERIRFTGRLSQPELKALLEQAAAVVIPSIWLENMPFSALETMAYGKAVIASRIGGLAELIRHEETGLSFTPGRSDELAAALISLSPDRAVQLGGAGREFVQALTLERHYDEIMKIFKTYAS